MAATTTRFSIQATTITGVDGVRRCLASLQRHLPYALVRAVEISGELHRVDVEALPLDIWQGWLARPEWHDKLIAHWLRQWLGRLSRPYADALQARWNDPRAVIVLHGELPFDPDTSPTFLEMVVLPRAEQDGCTLRVQGTGPLAALPKNEEEAELEALQRMHYGHYDGLTAG